MFYTHTQVRHDSNPNNDSFGFDLFPEASYQYFVLHFARVPFAAFCWSFFPDVFACTQVVCQHSQNTITIKFKQVQVQNKDQTTGLVVSMTCKSCGPLCEECTELFGKWPLLKDINSFIRACKESAEMRSIVANARVQLRLTERPRLPIPSNAQAFLFNGKGVRISLDMYTPGEILAISKKSVEALSLHLVKVKNEELETEEVVLMRPAPDHVTHCNVALVNRFFTTAKAPPGPDPRLHKWFVSYSVLY